jgi:hypothetical protein
MQMQYHTFKNHGGSGLDLISFLVEFSNEKDDKSCSVISVEVFAPSHKLCLFIVGILLEQYRKD